MNSYDYTLMKATVEEVVKVNTKELNDKLTEVLFHLKEIKELLYKQQAIPPASTPSSPSWPGWPYVTTCTDTCQNEACNKQVLNG